MFVTHLHVKDDIYFPFACEEWLCRRVGEGQIQAPVIHLWRHERAFVLGLRDSRLPRAREAMEWLESQGYRVMVRNSGGAAVPLDLGVVNVTLIQKGAPGQLKVQDDFRKMASLLAETLRPFGISFDTGEVKGSYCPGDFDLSIHGRKFCGLAQRRQLRGYAVQAFVNVEGDAAARASLVQEFYLRAAGPDLPPSTGALDVREETMGSLTELQPGFPGVEAWLPSLLHAFGNHHTLEKQVVFEIHHIAATLRERYDPRG